MSAREIMDECLRAVSAKDADAMLARYAPDAVLMDPHYPRDRLQGHEAIRAGMEWGFAHMRELTFRIERFYEQVGGGGAVAEVFSRHTLPNGRVLEFMQVFVVEIEGEKVARWQAYLPYGPHGIGGFMLKLGKKTYRGPE